MRIYSYTLEEIVRLLQPLNMSRVSRDTGVCRVTLSNLKNGKTTDCMQSTVQALSDYLEPR